MFKLKPNPTFWHTVDIPCAGEDPQPLEVEYRRLPGSQLVAFGSTLEGRSKLDACAEIMAGWRNADGEFSRDALAQLLEDYPAAGDALLVAYADAHRAAKRGN